MNVFGQSYLLELRFFSEGEACLGRESGGLSWTFVLVDDIEIKTKIPPNGENNYRKIKFSASNIIVLEITKRSDTFDVENAQD